MAFTQLVTKAQTYFPTLQVKYKDQDPLMQFLGKVMFFDPTFMTNYLTTIGNTVYIPSQQYVADNPQATCDVFIHECTHMYDEKRLGKIPYALAYLFPLVLAAPVWFLLFVLNWKIVLLISLLFLAPLPAPWRAAFEKKAYFVQMYAAYKLWGYDPNESVASTTADFTSSSYYFMWPFEQTSTFTQEATNVLAGNPSCTSEPALLAMVNDLIAAAAV